MNKEQRHQGQGRLIGRAASDGEGSRDQSPPIAGTLLHHQLAQLTAHEGPVWQVSWAYPKFGSLLASCSYDGRVIIWKEGNQNEWTQAHVFDDHKSSVNSIAWAPHEVGLCLACGSSDGNISVFTARPDGGWDTSRIDQAHPVGVTSVSWAPSTAPGALVGSGLLDPVQKLCSGGCDNTVKVWKLYNGTWKMDCFPALQMHTDWVRDVAWAPNLGLPKSTIASASQDGKVIIWTVGKEGDQWEGKVLHDFKTPVWRVSWSLTGNIVAVADGNDNVTLWNEAVDGEWQQENGYEVVLQYQSSKLNSIMIGNKGIEKGDFDGFALDMSTEEEEEEDGEEVEEDEDEGDDGELEEQENDNSVGRIEADVATDGSGVRFYQQFDHVEYEALAAKKRKGLGDCEGAGSGKKARQEDISGASMDEIMEAMNYGIKRKSRKLKKRGRRKGSKNKLSPKITKMLGDATVLYAHGRYEEAISVLNEVVRLAPHVPDSYHTLGLVHIALGNTEKAMGFYTIAARLMPKDSPLWRVLFDWHNERGDVARARLCLSKAIRADPNDIALRVLHASLYAKLGDCQRAAESYEQISRVCPEDVEVLKISAKLYAECGQTERSISILENYLKGHPSGADFGVIDLLAAVLMETNAHNNALKHIEHAHQVYYSGKEMPLQLKIKAGICHVHLGNIEKSEIIFSDLESESDPNHAGLITDVADAFMSLGHFHAALKYYLMLESNAGIESEGYIQLKIAQCYLSLKDRVKAVTFFYKALHALEDNVDCRLALASLILEDGKEDEAISLLSPPENSDFVNSSSDKQKQWWLDGKIKLKLCHIYRAKGMFEDFVNTIFPLVRESLYVKTLRQKVKKRLTISVLRKRTKILDVGETVDVFGGVRPLASRSDLMKASRARKLLQKREEQKAVARAAGIDWHGDDSEDESLEEEIRVPPLPNFLKDEEHHNLIIDLCKALQSLQRYWEALEIINLTRKLVNKKLPLEKKEELQSIAAQISYKTTDPKHGFDCVKSIVLQHPYSLAAWNCYYKIALRLGKNYSRHAKFLRHMRTKHGDCVPPIVIYGHQFTMASHYQDAVREYLAAYKLLPENPLVNLCVGTAFINLALGFRLQNKHQCVAQGLSFLYNNLRLAENSQVSLQEALYNIACAFHHVGLVSLAASYYEKVLETCERDYPIPKLLNENSDLLENLKPGYCDLRREAAYNLHLIYKKSGAIDLARQVLKDHCTC